MSGYPPPSSVVLPARPLAEGQDVNSYFSCYAGRNLLLTHEQLHHLAGRVGHGCARAEDGGHACLIEEVIVLSRDHTTSNHHDVLTSQFLQFLYQLRNEGLVTCCQRGCANDVDIVLHGLASCFCGSLEQGTHIHVEATIGITGGYYLGTAVVTILTHLGNHDTGTAALLFCILFSQLTSLLKVLVILGFTAIHA